MAAKAAPDEIRQVLERAITRLCPGWLQSSRDDLVQSAMLRLLERHLPDEGKPPLKASYLYKTAHSVLIDEIRRIQRRGETALDETAAIEDRQTADPYQMTVSDSLSIAMRECLARLTRSRCLGVALYLQGHRIPEIARLLDWPGKKADNSVYRGLANLRDCLKEKGFEPA